MDKKRQSWDFCCNCNLESSEMVFEGTYPSFPIPSLLMEQPSNLQICVASSQNRHKNFRFITASPRILNQISQFWDNQLLYITLLLISLSLVPPSPN
ncbi:hypothetical protein CEXT_32011 [Caerostris extrusa]|uniref:Uncharacterized protein n=1 Tax=Caerostris extrusa TaxID=172846 RepID=A0AAV4S215_CAEEX|nr:hypothetical protein CEXT_32011 [Caerostris extrusa]